MVIAERGAEQAHAASGITLAGPGSAAVGGTDHGLAIAGRPGRFWLLPDKRARGYWHLLRGVTLRQTGCLLPPLDKPRSPQELGSPWNPTVRPTERGLTSTCF